MLKNKHVHKHLAESVLRYRGVMMMIEATHEQDRTPLVLKSAVVRIVILRPAPASCHDPVNYSPATILKPPAAYSD